MPEILKEWAGYNGTMTEEKKPDGSVKKTKHDKLWAIAFTESGHIYVRYGPARHPLKLTEQIIRPKHGMSEVEALSEAERIFQEKVQEKLCQKGYEVIPFGVSPHYIPSFSKWRMSDEPEEVVTPVYEVIPLSEHEPVKSLQEVLEAVSLLLLEHPCPTCRVQHPRYLVDIGQRLAYTPKMLLSKLRLTHQGTSWLSVPCLRQENALLHAETRELLGMLIDTQGGSACTLQDEKQKEMEKEK